MRHLLEIDRSAFGAAFARRSIAVQHRLVDHPLLQPRCDSRARRPPAARLGPAGARQPPAGQNREGYVDVGQGPPSATILDVERNGFRISLRDIQQDAEYAALIDECLDQVDEILRHREGGMRRRTGYLFITAPAVEHADALRPRAQLPAPGPGHQARERGGLR